MPLKDNRLDEHAKNAIALMKEWKGWKGRLKVTRKPPTITIGDCNLGYADPLMVLWLAEQFEKEFGVLIRIEREDGQWYVRVFKKTETIAKATPDHYCPCNPLIAAMLEAYRKLRATE